MPASGNGKISDLSSTIAAGGTAQALSAANELRRGYRRLRRAAQPLCRRAKAGRERGKNHS